MVGGSSQSIPLTLKPSPSKAMTQEEKYKKHLETQKLLDEIGLLLVVVVSDQKIL